TITDKSGKYAPISVGFEVYAETIPASYNENTEKPGLTKAAGATDTEFADYIKNITSVSVNGKSYAASGRGAVKLFNDDGTLITDAAPFAEGDSFEIVVTATGYKNLSFTYKKAATDTPTPTPTETPTVTPTETPTVTPTETPTVTPTETPTVTPTTTPTTAPTTTPTTQPTKTPTSTPKATSTPLASSNVSNTSTSKKSDNAKTGDVTNIWGWVSMAVASLGAGGLGLKLRGRKKNEDEE
ncbi:hemoblobin-interacting domain-containing protein, partial [Fusicatenibacter sp.]